MEDVQTKTQVEALAEWVFQLSYKDLSNDAIDALKSRLLDSIGCAIGAIDNKTPKEIRCLTDALGGNAQATLIGGGKTSLVNAAFYNSALVRYLDYNDSYLAKNETGHPSDNIAAVLAAAENSEASGKDLLLAIAIAYQVQCRLSDEAPVRDKGFDHTVQGNFAAAAGVAKALNLSQKQIAQAISIAATAYNALRVTRTGELSNWKGLAYPNTAMGATHASLLAKYGITGPREVFEGNKGFIESIAGQFELDWSEENLEKVTETITKRYNAEIHSQASIEGLLELKKEIKLKPEAIKAIHLETFDVAFNIIGGGEEGDKKLIRHKEEADHSLPYMLAVAYLDDQVMPAQYEQARILSGDVQSLLQKIHVTPKQAYSDRFPDEMACRITLETYDGEIFSIEKNAYQGFKTEPAAWETLMEKYNQLTRNYNSEVVSNIARVIKDIENHQVSELTDLLSQL